MVVYFKCFHKFKLMSSLKFLYSTQFGSYWVSINFFFRYSSCSISFCIHCQENWTTKVKLFFRFKKKDNISHVAMVISNDKEGMNIIHSTSSKGVMIEDISASKYWQEKLLFGRRYIEWISFSVLSFFTNNSLILDVL